MPKKGDRTLLYVRDLPPGLLGRINGTAEYLELVRDEFVIELLRQECERFEAAQFEAKAWWQSRLRRKQDEASPSEDKSRIEASKISDKAKRPKH
jgi:hypothetical protein